MVPKGWEFKNLEDLEGSDRPVVKAGPFGSSLKKEFYTETGYKIYGQEQVIADDAFYGDYYIDEKRYHSLKSCAVEPDDILISLVGTIGKVLLVPENAQPGVINPRLLRISLNKKQMSSKFFKYFLESRPTVNLLDRWAQGGTMGVLNAATLKALKVPVPPLLEQQKIAKILSTWDKAISTTERLIENSAQQKKALMQQLLTGKNRLLDDEGKRFKDDWKEVKLEDICIINPKKPIMPEDGLVSFVPMDAVSEDAKLMRQEIKKYGDVSKGFTSFINEDVIVAKITPCFENGKGAFIDGLHNGIGFGSTEFHVLRAKENNHAKFIYYLSLTSEFRNKGKMNMQGSAGHKRVTTDYLKLFKLLAPPSYQEQQKIATVLTNADKEIELLEQQLADLQQEKKALMQVLLTGKKRVVVDGEGI